MAGLAVAAFACCLMLAFASAGEASVGSTERLADGTVRTTYMIGPLDVTSGQNRIKTQVMKGTDRPAGDGWITRIKPDLVNEDGSIPLSSKVMFHHGVWVNASRIDPTTGRPGERFFATGEEKTIMDLPDGYGYRYEDSDLWFLNHMIHNLVPEPMTLYITYTVDFVPDGSPAAAGMERVDPIWMDVQNKSGYPVFDVHRGDGGKDGEFEYPQDIKGDAYPVSPKNPTGEARNEWTADRDGVLIGMTGHVHTGGLATDLYLRRDGAKYAGPRCRKTKSWSKMSKKGKRKFRKCLNSKPTVEGNRVHLFESGAHYFEPAGPVSWDVAMISTRDNYRVAVKAGDILELGTTYETKMASWYESMGINVMYMAAPGGGKDPYRTKVDGPGIINHGHYAENDDHGGKKPLVGPDPSKLPDGLMSGGPFLIGGYSYEAGDFRLPGAAGRPPVVAKGQSFTFNLSDEDAGQEIWHSLTSCKSPCNKSTGIAYPIADGEFQFDSGQLGNLFGVAAPPTVGRTTWSTPADLSVGTHTYFCRIHPLMRGAFRVVPPKKN